MCVFVTICHRQTMATERKLNHKSHDKLDALFNPLVFLFLSCFLFKLHFSMIMPLQLILYAYDIKVIRD